MTQDTEDVVARLRLIAKQHSETSRMMAQSKSLRQAHTPPRDDLYMWATPEQTTEWKAADLIQSLSDRIDGLEGEKRAVEAQRRELQMLLVRHGDHEAIKKAGDFWPEARTVFDGRCLKCGGTHLGMPGGCDGPSRPSQPHPHARDMIA